MYTPIQSEYAFTGYYRTIGYSVITIGVFFSIVSITYSLPQYSWPLVFVGLLVVVLSYLPCLTWCSTELRVRSHPFTKAQAISFSSVYTLMITNDYVKIRTKELKTTLIVPFKWFSKRQRMQVFNHFRNLEEHLKATVEPSGKLSSEGNNLIERAKDPMDAYFLDD